MNRVRRETQRRSHPWRARALIAGLTLTCAVAASLAIAADLMGTRPDSSRRSQHAEPADAAYKSPVRLLLSADGQLLYVACEGTDEILVVATDQEAVVDRIAVGREPFGLALSPDGGTLYVTNRWDNNVSVVDLVTGRLVQNVAVGDDPHSVVCTPNGTHLFVANLSTDDLSVVETGTLTEVKRLAMGQAPFDIALSPGAGTVYVSNQYSNPVPFRTPPVLELTVVDTRSQLVRERRELYSTIVGQDIAVSPDGKFVASALELPKNLIPETQIYQGWMVTHGIALTETRPGGRSAYLLIDEPNLYFADPYGIAFTPDGRYLYVSSSGADAVSVIDMARVLELLEVRGGELGVTDEEIRRFARHLGLSNEYIVARVPTGSNPKGLVVSPDGRRVYVAGRLSDQITVIDVARQQVAGTIDLGGPQVLTELRRGSRLFNYASISFQNQLSCNTCHPENHVDGLAYDIAVDGGMGRNLVDNMTLRGIAETAPFKWSGKNPTLQRQEGPRAAQLFFRTHGFNAEENEAVVHFIESIPMRPNRYRGTGESLNEFQQRGKELYERAYDRRGRYIPVANRCVTCHPPPYGTNRKAHDVGSQNAHDRDGVFDTPHLNNVYEKPPYMHDGRCYSLEEIWTRFNPDDTHGVTNDMTKDELNCLIEYVKTF